MEIKVGDGEAGTFRLISSVFAGAVLFWDVITLAPEIDSELFAVNALALAMVYGAYRMGRDPSDGTFQQESQSVTDTGEPAPRGDGSG